VAAGLLLPGGAEVPRDDESRSSAAVDRGSALRHERVYLRCFVAKPVAQSTDRLTTIHVETHVRLA
jgi:hypothetical protein